MDNDVTRPAAGPDRPRLGRRGFLGAAGLAAGAGLLTACSAEAGGGAAPGSGEGGVIGGGGPSVEWDMPTSWPAGLVSLFGTTENGSGATGFAQTVAGLTGGNFVITPQQAGEVAGALEILDVVESGAVPCGHTAAYYYIGRSPAFAFSTSVPFGLTFRQMYAWLYHYRDDSGRRGLDVLRQFYADRFNIIGVPAGNTGCQMGGFFNREIRSLADLQGLTMRIPGLGGQVMSRLGVTTQNLAAGEIAQALQTGAVDAAEFVGPLDDDGLGLGEAAPFYYYPGWWEPGAMLEVMISLDAWNELPPEYRTALDLAGETTLLRTMGVYDALQPQSLANIEAAGAQALPFPDDVMAAARTESDALIEELAAADADVRTIWDHMRPYRDAVARWHGTAELEMLRSKAQR
jgi:TRAP-type mannitol/chloroaromatic compound transport system substrate-binding protein